MRAQGESVLGIVLSPKHISVAEMQFVGSELQVSALGDIPPPEGTFDANQIASAELLGRAISEFLVQKRLNSRKAVVVLPEAATITQLIKLPAMPHEDMLGAVRSVAERYAVFAEHAVSADCAVVEDLEEEGVAKASVLLAASRTGNVERCQEAARAAGLDLVSVEACPIVAARSYKEKFVSSQVVALAVVGEVKTDVMIFDAGVLSLCYSANAGLTEEVEAAGDWMTPPRIEGEGFSLPPQLYSELTHCFRFFQNQFPGKAVERVIMAADHPKADLAASSLASQLQLPVELGRPSYELRLPTEVDEAAAYLTRTLTLALFRGCALAASAEGEYAFPIDLLPPSRLLWLPARRAAKIAVFAMAVVLVAAIVWAVSLGRKITQSERQLASVQAEITRLQPELEALRAAKATELALKTEVEREAARLARERAVRWSQILVDTAQRLPHDMWLTHLNSPDNQRISVTGIATNRETIPLAIESLSGSPYLSNVVLGSLSKDDNYSPGRVVIRYQINAVLLRGTLPPAGAGASPAQPKEPTP